MFVARGAGFFFRDSVLVKAGACFERTPWTACCYVSGSDFGWVLGFSSSRLSTFSASWRTTSTSGSGPRFFDFGFRLVKSPFVLS